MNFVTGYQWELLPFAACLLWSVEEHFVPIGLNLILDTEGGFKSRNTNTHIDRSFYAAYSKKQLKVVHANFFLV